MKKGLSVLLIAAALFGFYGGATNIQDVLAAKQYWEDKSEQTTADLNKLEDGLNTLDENKEAYLDGLDKVADGEKALADGEAELAQGEADYAAAPGKLEQGEKDLAAGKAKLAAGYAAYNQGEKDLAAGKQAVAAGEEALAEGKATASAGIAGINQVIKYLRDVKTGYKDYSTENGKKGPSWKAGYNKLKDGRSQMLQKFAEPETAGLLGMIKDVSGNKDLGKNINNSASYKDFNDSVVDMIKTFKGVSSNLTNVKAMADEYKDDASLKGAAALLKLPADIDNPEYNPDDPESKQKIPNPKLGGKTHAQIRDTVAKQLGSLDTSKLAALEKVNPEQYAALTGAITTLTTNSGNTSDAVYAGTIEALQSGLADLSEMLNGYITKLNAYTAKDGDLQAWTDGYTQLAGKQAYIHDSLKQIYSGILDNSTLKNAFKDNAPKLYTYMNAFKAGVQYGGLSTEDFPKFVDDMDAITGTYNPNIIATLQAIKKSIADEVKKGEDELNAGKAKVSEGSKALAAARKKLAQGEKDLAAGKAQLAQGYADYAAAPGKLEEGRQKLADGRKELAAGKEKLAEYEDGEQQVRDGLATLMASDRYADLQTIMERRNGDDNFDAADKSLDIPDGLEAVGTGREYQADTGEVVTSELTGRILGSGLELGAAAVALLAAVLSLLKKYKGAAVSAIAAAAVGVSGIIAGNNAGMEMSTIAGSNMGATPMVAAGILAAVAAVFSIVHFTAKKDA